MGRWADLKQKWADGWERRMMGWGWSLGSRDYFWHAWRLFLEQVAAIIPISVLQARAPPLPAEETATSRSRHPLLPPARLLVAGAAPLVHHR